MEYDDIAPLGVTEQAVALLADEQIIVGHQRVLHAVFLHDGRLDELQHKEGDDDRDQDILDPLLRVLAQAFFLLRSGYGLRRWRFRGLFDLFHGVFVHSMISLPNNFFWIKAHWGGSGAFASLPLR